MRIRLGNEEVCRIQGRWSYCGARATRECVGPVVSVLDLLEEARGLLHPILNGEGVHIPSAVHFLQKTDVSPERDAWQEYPATAQAPAATGSLKEHLRKEYGTATEIRERDRPQDVGFYLTKFQEQLDALRQEMMELRSRVESRLA